ncbi:putative membrane protein [Rhodoferax antarcticus ANT.BR]|uniref:Putative membrane protein n=1 Tax=Rhodoferax antarcticus ANT.BR TaxID=1111071 RepID=A0A1Q8Y978_9BURK|nr:putative membrane protein [Rhodoferax antarcticus ANT.BR]
MGFIGFDVAGMADALLVSLTCAVAGYLQWFRLLPWLWRKWKSR